MAAEDPNTPKSQGDATEGCTAAEKACDVTSRRRAEESLRFTQFAVDRAGDAVHVIDEEARLVYVNESMCRSLGYTRDELLSMTVCDIDADFLSNVVASAYGDGPVPASLGYSREELLSKTASEAGLEVVRRIWRDALEALRRRKAETIETCHRRNDRTLLPVEIRATYFEHGGKPYSVAFARDLTERKRTEESLRLTQFAMDCAGDAAMIIDKESRLVYVNETMCRSLGYAREELLSMTCSDLDPDFLRHSATLAYGDGAVRPSLGLSWEELVSRTASEIDPEVVSEILRDTLDVLQRGSPEALETFHRRKDGTSLPVEISATYLEHDGRRYNVAFARDISDRKRAEEARLVQVHFLESLDRVNRVIQQADDVEKMLWEVAETVLSIYGCDRVWLLYPCDPHAPSFRVPVECTRPEYPGACALNLEVPMSPGQAQDMREALASDGPIGYTLGTERPVSEETARRFGVEAQMLMAVYPKTGEPWLFGMHQCSHARVWTEDGRRLFKEVGRRMGDALGELLILRDLRESEKRYRNLVERMIDVIYTLDCQGIVTSVNVAIETLLGFTPEEVVGRDFAEFLHEESRPRAQQAFERVLREGETTDTTVMIDKAGGLRYVEFSSSAVEQDGHVVGARGIIRDLTDRKRAEDLVRAQRDLGATLGATSSLDECLRLGLEAAIRVSQADCGGVYLVDEFSGGLKLACHHGLPPAFVASVSTYGPDSPHVRLLKGAKPAYSQHRSLDLPLGDAERSEGLRAFAALPLRHEDRVIGYMNVASHVLEQVPEFCRPSLEAIANQVGSAIGRIKAEQALRDSEQRYRDLVENSTYGVAIHQNGEILYVNRAAVDMLGYASAEEMLGKSALELVHPDHRADVVSRIRRVLELGDPAPLAEEKFLAKDGRVVDAEVAATRMAHQGRPAVQAIFADVTERKQAEERLRQMETQLAHVSRVSAMGEMVAGVAHEISQPLYAVVNFAKASGNCLAAEGEPDVKTLREWNQAIAEAAARAGGIIQRLRDFVRRAPPQRDRVGVNEVVRESVELLAFEAHRRGIAVSLNLSEAAPSAFVDRVQLQQVLVNLVQNALEALDGARTDGPPRVTIRTGVRGQFAIISVADNGPGLPQDESKIFDAFVTTKAHGLGMGLAIGRSIVETHGGKLSAVSDPDGGAAFHLTLPMARGQGDF